MFKWPGTPSARAPKHELADYAELVCWQGSVTSVTALSRDLGRLEENDHSGGVSEEEVTEEVVGAAYVEIEQRHEACRNGYPFLIDKHGHALQADQKVGNHKYIIYKYLLLATRLNMQNNRVHANIDGTLLFEKLAAETAKEYLGNRAESTVFGTGAATAKFQDKVDTLCRHIEEGGGYENRGGTSPSQKDGKLDIVVWKPFADRLPGKLIAFGQCKTGTNYKDTLTQLQPDSFCAKWLRSPLIPIPVRMFFVAEALSRSAWAGISYDAGLVFDRCRIVDFCDNISTNVLKEAKTWTAAAAQAAGLPSV